MASTACVCLGDDGAAAKDAIRTARGIARLADESHFGVSLRQCAACGQHFLTLFCERVDWVDGDDPQTWVAIPVSGEEAEKLRSANVAADEYAILDIVATERRFLINDMPKGAPSTLAWVTRRPYIPAHD
jgi:hypothetical protein